MIGRAKEDGRKLGLDGLELRAFVRRQYPFGERQHWPYKVWLDEIRRAFPPRAAPIAVDWFPRAREDGDGADGIDSREVKR